MNIEHYTGRNFQLEYNGYVDNSMSFNFDFIMKTINVNHFTFMINVRVCF